MECLIESMYRHIGQTVTIFTTSGGLSGEGFTGVLVGADRDCVRLLCDVGMAPTCPIGSSCTSYGSASGLFNNVSYNSNGFYGNPFGAIAVIPTHVISCFTHNAI